MFGQGLMPEDYHPIVNLMDDKELKNFLTTLESSVDNIVGQLPSHNVFLEKYCKAEALS